MIYRECLCVGVVPGCPWGKPESCPDFALCEKANAERDVLIRRLKQERAELMAERRRKKQQVKKIRGLQAKINAAIEDRFAGVLRPKEIKEVRARFNASVEGYLARKTDQILSLRDILEAY